MVVVRSAVGRLLASFEANPPAPDVDAVGKLGGDDARRSEFHSVL